MLQLPYWEWPERGRDLTSGAHIVFNMSVNQHIESTNCITQMHFQVSIISVYLLGVTINYERGDYKIYGGSSWGGIPIEKVCQFSGGSRNVRGITKFFNFECRCRAFFSLMLGVG